MKLQKLILSNFQCYEETKTTINLEKDLSVLIGLNGTGKTSTLQALSRLFGVSDANRKIRIDDFHCPRGTTATRSESLFIEAWFNFPQLNATSTADELTAAIGTFNQLCFSGPDNSLLLRIRLEATQVTDDISPDGIVTDNIYYITTDDENPREENKNELRRTDRNNIQVHYIPASRNPFKEITSSTKVLLGRLINAINWDRSEGGELHEALNHTRNASTCLSQNEAISLIQNQIKSNWNKMYSGDLFSEATISFLPLIEDELIKTISLSFLDSSGLISTMDKLSDGQRSLLHISIIQAIHELESNILRNPTNRAHFNQDKLKKPIFTLLALEEPENHLAPHYLGRIIKSMKQLASTNNAQVVMTTHSPSLVGRVEPTQLRYFKIDISTHSTRVLKIPLPPINDEYHKYVAGAVKAFPEIYFARLVILGEGESEKIVLPRIISEMGTDIDDSFITIAPLGGRHVNHFWKLLNNLSIPHITLLDLDLGRSGGGWGRIKYSLEQLKKYKPELNISARIISDIPSWNDASEHPLVKTFIDPDDASNPTISYKDYLEKNNVFFSAPIDLDYALQKAFPEQYNITIGNESGPTEQTWDDLKPKVLKKGYEDSLCVFYSEADDKNDFLWYNYRFLGTKGKPTAHINALEEINFSIAENRENTPNSLKSLIRKAETIISELQE